jgi:hypothetical protein
MDCFDPAPMFLIAEDQHPFERNPTFRFLASEVTLWIRILAISGKS